MEVPAMVQGFDVPQVMMVAVPPGTPAGAQMMVAAPSGAHPSPSAALVGGVAAAGAAGAAVVSAGVAGVNSAIKMVMGPARLHGIAGMAQMLESSQGVKIQQKIHGFEAVSGGCCEQSNEYRIFGGGADAHGRDTLLFNAKEQSGGCDRVCCKPHNNLLLHINAHDTNETLITLERKGMKCNCNGPRQCLFCPILGEFCAEEMIVHEGLVQGEPGNINPATKLSLIRQPAPLGGCLVPTLEILNAQDQLDTKMTGPTCFGGWSEMCCDSTFVVKRDDAPVATIRHLAPRDCGEACKALCTDSDNFEVTFDPSVSAMDKANAIATSLLVDFMFFEIDQGLCHVEGNVIYCTLCLCFCAGALVPLNCCCALNENGGGAPAAPETAGGAPTAADAEPLLAAPRAQLLPIMRHKMEHHLD
ncbi:hypothetical protein JL721_7339 [Aureococcus anophagefferens]|nr:hypothetical protein JL721_7339 [Aureococcus anophagefferens]